MYNFFAEPENKTGDGYLVVGADFNHIKNVLRMRTGEEVLVSLNGKSDLCVIEKFMDDAVKLKILQEDYNKSELDLKIYLFQGLPKSDKLELIIQKAVELGSAGIIPVEMSRCVVKLDPRKKASKTERYRAIAESAAKQSKRNTIPEVFEPVSLADALKKASQMDLFLVPYENEDGILSTKQALSKLKDCKTVGILIGPEGGFDEKEIEDAKKAGGKIISLGKRILRTETAAITALSMCMLAAELCEMGRENDQLTKRI